MIDIKKLSSEDLIERTEGLNADIEDNSKVGSIHLKINGVYANLQVPTIIDTKKEISLFLKFDSLNDKVAFTFGDIELREQIQKITDPYKYDKNYILFEKENVYQVFVKNGVVAYLTEEEVTGLYVIFREIKKVLESKYNYN
ncbi:hypothetical protein [Bacillus weihaiensis]|uniref:hypothetical protein n=1 Tax=Bacillus weihaiensis TaxID=1547283 RepID=UPI002354E40A|nr:hypothetical protein [Bacillus weihaiensis]